MTQTFLWYAFIFALLVAAVYVVVRVGSFAYFRTRYEHFLRTMRELDKGE